MKDWKPFRKTTPILQEKVSPQDGHILLGLLSQPSSKKNDATDMNQKSSWMQRLLQARCQPCMNNNFRICLFILLLVFVSCKKEQQQMLSNPGNSIVGKWELRKNYGSLPPQYYDAGN